MLIELSWFFWKALLFVSTRGVIDIIIALASFKYLPCKRCSVIVSTLVGRWNVVTVLLLHLLHLVGAHVVVQHWVRHHWRRGGTQVLVLTVPCRGGFHQLLVSVRLRITEVAELPWGLLAILHLVLVWMIWHLHHTIVLLVVVHQLTFFHVGDVCVPRVQKLLLLLQEHLHWGRLTRDLSIRARGLVLAAHHVGCEIAQIHIDIVQVVDVKPCWRNHIVIRAIVLGHVYRCVRWTMVSVVHLVHAHLISWNHSVSTKHAWVIVYPLSSSLVWVIVNIHAWVMAWLVNGAHANAIVS